MGGDESKAGGANEDGQVKEVISTLDGNGGKAGKGSTKLKSILDAIPDFTFLTEPSVSMG